MSIPLYGSDDDLFPRLGRIGKVALLLQTAQAGIDTVLVDLLGRYPAAVESLTGQLAITRDGLQRNTGSGLLAQLQALAQSTLVQMVADDQPARTDAVAELIRQMKAAGDSVAACTVTASVTPDGTNTGDGVAVISTKRGDGLTLENMVAESARLTVSLDSRTGGRTAGAELVRFNGTANVAGVWDWDFPQGSGAQTSLNSAMATQDYPSTANVLRNSGFDAWTTTNIDYWTISNVTKETSLVYGSGTSTANNAARVAAGATGTLTQQFAASSTGTGFSPPPLTSLAFCLRVRGSASLSAGTLTVKLVDGSGTTLQDDTGSNQIVSFNLNGTTTAWTAKTGFLRTPRIMPSTAKIVVTVSGAVGGDVILDHMAVSRLTTPYAGGPGLAVFGGATPFLGGDGWSIATTNDYAGASYGMTWQSLFARLFGTTATTLLPSSGSPTVLDSLISS